MKINPRHPLISCPTPVAHQPVCHLSPPANFSQRSDLKAHINRSLAASPEQLIWGGYLEQRDIYSTSEDFLENGSPRNIHLGIDIWAAALTPIYAPLDARIHSLQDNQGFSNYGPTIVLVHEVEGQALHSLYGHLSRASLDGKKVGDRVRAGDQFCELGIWEENGDWPPHLHFQLIKDMGDWWGDYPGACTIQEKPIYAENCPDPVVFLEV